MIRVVIADDEPVALKRLEIALKCVPEAQIVGSASNGTDALALIRQCKPDVAILDIKMPGKSGLNLVAALAKGDDVPAIIFLTAFEQHAVKAYELSVVDYIMKPAPFERLRQALRRAHDWRQSRSAQARFAELQELLAGMGDTAAGREIYKSELWIRDRDGITRIAVGDIDRIDASGDYVLIHAGGERHLMTAAISSLERELNPETHLRVHRGTILNVNRIRSLRRRGRGMVSAVLTSGAEVAVGPSYTERVMAALNARRWR